MYHAYHFEDCYFIVWIVWSLARMAAEYTLMALLFSALWIVSVLSIHLG